VRPLHEATWKQWVWYATDVGMNPELARTVWTAMVEWFVQHEERELG
jgi:hypothetical protein